MTLDEMAALFNADDDDFLAFSLVENPRHPRPDLAAFLLLDDLVPSRGDPTSPNKYQRVGHDMVAGAEHDEIFLNVEPEALAARATPEDIRTLRRCGVRYDNGTETLCMFV